MEETKLFRLQNREKQSWFDYEQTRISDESVHVSLVLTESDIQTKISDEFSMWFREEMEKLVNTSTPLATLTPFPQLPYSSPTSISTPLASSSRPLEPTPSSVPSFQGVVNYRILILSIAERRDINGTQCMSVPFGMLGKNKPYYDTRIQGLDLMFEAASGSNKGHVYGLESQSLAITTECREGSSSSSSVPSISSTAAHESCIKMERKLCGYMHQAQNKFAGFMNSFASHYGVHLHSVPTLFPNFLPRDDDATSQPPTSLSSSSSPPPSLQTL
ncbi:hypothetical protein M9H77_35068 [Catharanthus roseus]|uniref:Uncharacterized protein n=1 Tax=Catharanthus roseus TaxID=4058 RepID=A0ACB9ZNP7_CATRO|nr:hypothetical protein M9H77_35068 [Catharanthus roseus]